MVQAIFEATLPEAGVQRAQLFGGGLEVSPRDHIYSPLPSRKGARGMVEHPLRQSFQPDPLARTRVGARIALHYSPGLPGAPQALQGGRACPEGAAPWQGSGGVPQSSNLPPFLEGRGQGDGPSPNRSAAPASRESRGVQPHWQEAWRMCLHNLLLFTFPLPSRKGARGMVRATRLPRRFAPRNDAAWQQESRGRSPLAGVWGCPPEISLFPLPYRKGARGMVPTKDKTKPAIL